MKKHFFTYAVSIFCSFFLCFSCASKTDTPPNIDAKQAYQLSKDTSILFIDVRDMEDTSQLAYGIKNLRNIPLAQLDTQSVQLSKKQPIVLVCNTGNKSQQAYELLQKKGFSHISSLEGGIKAWQTAGYPVQVGAVESEQKQQLDARRAQFNEQASESIKRAYADALEVLQKNKTAQQVLQVGSKAPDFTLVNGAGKSVNLYHTLKKYPVILVWYRGGWCPYCNIALSSLQKHLNAFEKAGARILALSPERADSTQSTQQKLSLTFNLLSDKDNQVARKYGLVFKLDKKVADIYNEKFHLNSVNGNDHEELPMPATFVIDKNGIIRYVFANEDYTQRAEPADLLDVLRTLK